jgi:serine/threonine-protein kinase
MGEVLGRYHIISELGRGGMGVVYKALDPKLERFIAIKCLSDELSADEIVVARFLREARNVAALNHPNIAQIFVADEHDGKPFFVMEYVDGESLADFIDREGQCSPEMARRVTEQAAHALAAAAAEGIVHRDVKPGNIMIDRRGRAVLTDFGIACVAAEQGGAGSQQIMGTPGYLAPEALSGGPVDSRSDQFALGAVWYEMLTGDRLMPSRDLKETFKQFAQGEFPELSRLEGHVDDRVVEIIRKMLSVQPEDRYADWRELLADMKPLKTGRTGPVERDEAQPSTAEREVTAALSTARTDRQTAATQTAAAASAPEATAVMGTEPPPKQPPAAEPPRRKGNGLWIGLAIVILMAMTAGAFGLARMDPDGWGRLTAWLPGFEAPTEAAPASSPDAEAETGEEAVATSSTESATAALSTETGSESNVAEMVEAPAPSGVDSAEVASARPDDQAPTDMNESSAAAELSVAESAQTESVPEPAVGEERQMAMADAAAARATTPEIQPAAPPPRGVVVIGVGDPVIADPMVREIESALRGGSHPLIQRNFVRGYRDYIQGEELDLAGLSDAALDAGARYVVVARALPAGERELQYYNRVETAFIAQLEAVTYDLHDMRQMGSSPVEQIEFTALNATRRAVDSVQPWLPGLRRQFQ